MKQKVLNKAKQDIDELVENVETVIVGKGDTIRLLVAALLSRGHVLLEDKPGLGKTMLARALARSIDCSFKRLQCTPDLLPVDVTGYHDPRTQKLKKGPVFTNVLLADELNRAIPRTQSALLEAMAERQVTLEGETHRLDEPFMVIATQNPVEYRGVNDLPEAQMDRFQMVLSPGYPSQQEELQILKNRSRNDPIESLAPVIARDRVVELIRVAGEVTLDERLIKYLVEMVRATREAEELLVGASPRSALQLMQLSKASALTEGRDYVVPDDVKTIARHCLPHRMVQSVSADGFGADAAGKTEAVDKILARVSPP